VGGGAAHLQRQDRGQVSDVAIKAGKQGLGCTWGIVRGCSSHTAPCFGGSIAQQRRTLQAGRLSKLLLLLLPVPQMLCKQLTTTPMQMTASYLPLLAIALPTTGSSKLPGTHATCEQV
jgi:hypothetical protein